MTCVNIASAWLYYNSTIMQVGRDNDVLTAVKIARQQLIKITDSYKRHSNSTYH